VEGNRRSMGGGKRGGRKPDSQGGGKQEKKGEITLHNILQSKKCKEVGANKYWVREPGLKVMGSRRFKPRPPTPHPSIQRLRRNQKKKVSIFAWTNVSQSFTLSIYNVFVHISLLSS